MARAHYFTSLAGRLSDTVSLAPLTGALVNVYQEGTSTPITETLYSGASGAGTLANPLTAGVDGFTEFWLEKEKRLDIVIVATGFASKRVTIEAQQPQLVRYEVSAFDFMTEAQIADVQAGTALIDVASAIQAAIDSIKDVNQAMTDAGSLTAPRILSFPRGIYRISAPLVTNSGIFLRGGGPTTRIRAAPGYASDRLITLSDRDYYVHAEISDMTLDAPSGVAAIAAQTGASKVVGNSTFRRLYLNTGHGLLLNGYTQAVLVEDIYSYGPIDKIIHLKGNFNQIRGIDKEGSTGSSVDPYVLLEAHAAGSSTGNILENILIEGATNANKSGMKLDNTAETVLRGYWYEPTAGDGYALRIVGSTGYTRIEGPFLHVSTIGKLKINTSRDVWVDRISTDGQDIDPWQCIEVDATSHLVIEDLETRRGTDIHRLDKIARNVTMRQAFNRMIYTDAAAGWSPVGSVAYQTGQNLFVNPSFEAGRYGWTFGANPTTTEEYIQSEVGEGLMGHFKWSTTGSREIRQSIAVPSAWVGRPMTLAALVRITGSNFIAPYLSGAGITLSTGYQRVNAGSGWVILAQTFIPQSSGTLLCGINFVSVDSGTDVYVDEAYLGFGTIAMPNPSKAASLEVGGKTRAVASAAPASGTWKVGDMVWNSVPTEAGSAASKYVITGWVCTVAGAPGTWLEMRALTGN